MVFLCNSKKYGKANNKYLRSCDQPNLLHTLKKLFYIVMLRQNLLEGVDLGG